MSKPSNNIPVSDLRRKEELLHLLVEGDKEIEMGEGYDLDTVLAEADALNSHSMM